jgi:hypothetical protein
LDGSPPPVGLKTVADLRVRVALANVKAIGVPRFWHGWIDMDCIFFRVKVDVRLSILLLNKRDGN